MIRGKSHRRRLDPLLLLIAVVMLGALMTTAATAGEIFNFFPLTDSAYRLQPQDSGIMVASMGHEGGELNVSLTPPHELPHDYHDGRITASKQAMLSRVFLFIRYPW